MSYKIDNVVDVDILLDVLPLDGGSFSPPPLLLPSVSISNVVVTDLNVTLDLAATNYDSVSLDWGDGSVLETGVGFKEHDYVLGGLYNIEGVAINENGVATTDVDVFVEDPTPPLPLTWSPLEKGLSTGSISLNFTTVVYCGGTTYVASGEGGYASRTDDSGENWYPLDSGVGNGSSFFVLDML